MKKLLFITGTRADFGKLKPLLNLVEKNPRFELHLIVTGLHMMASYGRTYIEVMKENYKNVYLINNQFLNEPMSSILGNTINLFSRFFSEIEPDMIFVHGDRLEALAGAVSGAFENRLICHIEGGEISGTIDESIRHAISKFSHLHLVANQDAKDLLVRMGEDENKIFIIGSPDLDVMMSDELPSLDETMSHYGIEFEKYALSLFHPVTTEVDMMQKHSEVYFSALKKSGLNYVVIYPNNDNGSKFIIDDIKKLKSDDNFRVYPSIRFEYFLTLLKNAKFIIGNSSAGIREAPFYGVGTVNVGTRQDGRVEASSIINADYDEKEILDAIEKIKSSPKFEKNHEFGSGNSVDKFQEFLENSEIWETSLQKRFIK